MPPSLELDTIFSRAIEIAEESERTAYVDEACAGDDGLKEEVTALLRSHVDSHAAGFLSTLISPVGLLGEAGAEDVPVDMAETGMAFGAYEVLREIGRGGMGVVYLANEQKLGRRVALKMVRGGGVGRSGAERFEAEARAAAKLNHRNIVSVYAFGEQDGQAYFAMEFIDGPSLESLLKGQMSDPKAAAELVGELAEAVEYAHRHRVIHRDIKPANILLEPAEEGGCTLGTDGRAFTPRLSDFGVAKIEGDQAGLTLEGEVVGTPGYLAPEMLTSSEEGETPGAAIDIYSLGAVLYFMLTGRPPFQAPTVAATLRAVAEDYPIVPRALNPQVPNDLQNICLKALDRDPSQRYASAGAFGDDLRRFLENRPVEARPPSAFGKARRFVQRHPWASAAAVAMISLGIGALVLSLALAGEREKQAEGAFRMVARTTLDQAILISGDQGTVRGLEGMVEALESAEQAGDPVLAEAARLNLGAWSKRLPELLLQIEIGARPQQVALSEDGMLVAAGYERSGVVVVDVATGTEVARLPHPKAINGLDFHPDGTRLVSAGNDGKVRVWDIAAAELLAELDHSVGQHTRGWPFTGGASGAFFMTEDQPGDRIVTFGIHGGVRVWDALTFERFSPSEYGVGSPPVHGYASAVDIDADRRTVAVSIANPRAVVFWSIEDRGFRDRTLRIVPISKGVAFSPTDDTVLIGMWNSEHAELHRHRGEEGGWTEVPKLSLNHSATVTGVGFLRGGDVITTASHDHLVRLRDFRGSGEISAPLEHPEAVNCMATRPDLPLVVTGCEDGVVRVWRVPDPHAAVELRQGGWVRTVAFHPDGDRLFAGSDFAGGREGARVWDLEEKKPVPGNHFLLLGATADRWCLGAEFSPDGNTLYTLDCQARTVVVWDPTSREMIRTVGRHPSNTHSFSLSLETQMVAMAGVNWHVEGNNKHALTIWNLESGEQIGETTTRNSPIDTIAFHPDGSRLFVGSHDGRCGWIDPQTGLAVGPEVMLAGRPIAVALSPDQRHLAIGFGDGGARLYDAETLEPAGVEMEHPGMIYSLAFTPDGRFLVTSSGDRVARFWHIASGVQVGPALRHRNRAFEVTVSPDGKSIATASDDGFARVWNVPESDDRPVVELKAWISDLRSAP